MVDKTFPADFQHLTLAPNLVLLADDGISNGVISVSDLLQIGSAHLVISGAVVSAHRAVMTNSVGLIVAAMISSPSYNFVGISLQAATTINAPFLIATAGAVIVEPSWSWTPGAAIYALDNGLLSATPPSTGILHQIGQAINATSLLVQPLFPIVLN